MVFCGGDTLCRMGWLPLSMGFHWVDGALLLWERLKGVSLWKHISKGWTMFTNFVKYDIGIGDWVQFWGMIVWPCQVVSLIGTQFLFKLCMIGSWNHWIHFWMTCTLFSYASIRRVGWFRVCLRLRLWWLNFLPCFANRWGFLLSLVSYLVTFITFFLFFDNLSTFLISINLKR